MASLTRHSLTLVTLFFFVLLLLCSEATRPPSNSPYPTPAPTPTPAPALTTSTTPTPAPTPTPTPTPTPAPTPTTATPAPAGGPATDDSDSPISLKELLELALPEIGVQRKVDAGSVTTEGSKVASKQLQAVEHKINEFKAVLKKRLADPKTSEPIRECLSQCQDNFEDAIDGVKSSIESIDKKNLPKANVDVSAVSTDVDTCNDCFIEMIGEVKEIKAFDDWVRGVTGDCLINLQKH